MVKINERGVMKYIIILEWILATAVIIQTQTRVYNKSQAEESHFTNNFPESIIVQLDPHA